MTTEVGTHLVKEESASKAGEKVAKEALKELDSSEAHFGVVFCSPEYDLENLLKSFREASGVKKLTGCTTAGGFTEDNVENEGSVAVALINSDDMKFFTNLATGISQNTEEAVRNAAEGLPTEVDGHPHLAGINLHDGLQGVGETVSQLAYLQTGMEFAGGSAADEGDLQGTKVFTEEKVENDAVALTAIASKKPFGFGVGHGHEPISPELEVTEVEGSTVKELNGRPAFEVWKEYAAEKAEEELEIDVDNLEEDKEALTEMLTRYELGISLGDSYKVRWPGLTAGAHGTDGPLEFAMKLSEGTTMRVMSTTEEKEIKSPINVIKRAEDNLESEPSGALVFECFCHAQILGKRFSEATEGMAEELDKPLAGFESYGEVCHSQDVELRGYHNTTTSVLLLPE